MKNTAICQENDTDFYNKWFSQVKYKSFITHVDSLYFMVTPDVADLNNSAGWQGFLDKLETCKKEADTSNKPVPIYKEVTEGLEVRPFMAARMYSYNFGLKDNFDIFVCSSVPNENTPPIMVQIRSNALWIDGMKNSFDHAYNTLAHILGRYYGIRIQKVQENRIDYAFHTNYINDFVHFFPEKDLGKMFVGNFKRGRKDYNFHTHEEDEHGSGDRIVESDYFTIGRHKSNNVFLRVYNKTKEVIEMGYKQFFIPIWKKYGLINDFDEYVLRKAFIYGSYESKDKARCEFYYDYGKDDNIRREIYDKLKNPDTPAKWFTKTAKRLVPDITVVTNVELQTKRKFYDRKKLPVVTFEQSAKKNIYNIFEQMSELINFITEDTIRFVKYKGQYSKLQRTERPMAYWWEKLRKAKKVEITEKWEIEYIHIYQHNLDMERQKVLTLKKMAKMGSYLSYSEGEFTVNTDKPAEEHIGRDFEKTCELFNDNDLRKYVETKQYGIDEIFAKIRQNAVNEAKLKSRPPPKLRETKPKRCKRSNDDVQ